MTDLLTVVSFASILAGPYFSSRVPPMAPALRPWAFWLSGVAAAVSWAGAMYVIRKGSKHRQYRMTLIIVGGVGAVLCGFGYFVVNLVWTNLYSDWRDNAFRVLLVALYSLGCGALTLCITAANPGSD